MGVNNRQRRAAKKRKQSRASEPRTRSTRSWDLYEAHQALLGAVVAHGHGDAGAREDAVLALARRDPGWQALVSEAVRREACRQLGWAWEHGWQPLDLLRLVRRQLPKEVEPLLATALAVEAQSYRRVPQADADWLAQLEECGASEWFDGQSPLTDQLAGRLVRPVRAVIESVAALLALLETLPVLPLLRPPPQAWARSRTRAPASAPRPPVDPKLAARLRALLVKAEATEFEEEAAALTGKAQELMTRHSIDTSMLEDEGASPDVSARRVGVEDPYAPQKAALLNQISSANRCEVIWSKHLGFATIFGTSRDLAGVEMLYVSLLLQATRAMLTAGSQRDGAGRSRTRSFRSAFLAGFATRIGQRLRVAADEATSEATKDYGSALLPVLASRDSAVEDLRKKLMPETTDMALTWSGNQHGWSSGMAAAEVADLFTQAELRSA